MEHTEQQKQEFQQVFALRRKRQVLVTIPALILIVAAVIFGEEGAALPAWLPASVAIVILFGGIIGLLVFSLFNWRCPACGMYLGKSIGPRFCRSCGVQLRK